MTTPDTTPKPASKMRWIVKREAYRQPRFGETKQQVTAWAVRGYVRLEDGYRATTPPTYRNSLTAAHNLALAECRRLHGAGK